MAWIKKVIIDKLDIKQVIGKTLTEDVLDSGIHFEERVQTAKGSVCAMGERVRYNGCGECN